jgi:NADP-dependent 3-hydroxy acid dehydrogenase YdfG
MTRTIVITGASSGIGAALARNLGAAGNNLVLAARRRPELESVAREFGSRAIAVVADVTKREDVLRLRDEALRRFGSVGVWVNNAGRGIAKPALELTDADFDEMMAVNVKSALYGMQAIMPHFIERSQGHLINISSFLGRVPIATHRSAYNAAKAALNALTANVRVDLRAKYPALHVSLIMPGLVTTDFARHAIGSTGSAPPPWVSGGTMQPQTAEEVASAIADVIEHPVAELYTNPASGPMARRYFEDVGAFEESLHSRAAAPDAR